MIEFIQLEDYGALSAPRRVMKYLLIWCSYGSVVILVDEQEYVMHPGEVLTITSGQVHWLKDSRNGKGAVLEFTLDFFCKDDTDIELIFENGLFCHFDRNEVIPIPEPEKMERLLQQIRQDLTDKPYQYLISAHAGLELMLVAINRAKIGRGDEIWKPDALFLKFLEMVRGNFKYNYPLSHFASELQTTELKLNELARLFAGKTAQHVMYGLIVSEAKRLLTYEKMPVKEVAFSLGFNDPFYFSNFFKKHAGVSPKVYKQSAAF